MTTEQHNLLSVKFDGKNYSLWEFQFCMYVTGKELLDILDGIRREPEDDKRINPNGELIMLELSPGFLTL